MHFDLRQLRALSVVVEEGTFGRAAGRLGYTQSTISQQIATLERTVGGPVFDRPGGPRPVQLTALGRLVLNRGRKLLEDADRLGEAVRRFEAGEARVDIGTFQSVSTVILPAMVSRLLAEQPLSEINLSEGETEQRRMGDLDLLFSDGPVDDDVQSVRLLSDRYVLVARRSDFDEDRVALGSLSGRDMVAWPLSCDQPRMEQALRDCGSRPRVVFRSSSNETLIAMVRSGLGFTILPRLAVGTFDDESVRLFELDPSPSREIHLHWSKRRSLTPLARRAIELAQEIGRSVGEEQSAT